MKTYRIAIREQKLWNGECDWRVDTYDERNVLIDSTPAFDHLDGFESAASFGTLMLQNRDCDEVVIVKPNGTETLLTILRANATI